MRLAYLVDTDWAIHWLHNCQPGPATYRCLE